MSNNQISIKKKIKNEIYRYLLDNSRESMIYYKDDIIKNLKNLFIYQEYETISVDNLNSQIGKCKDIFERLNYVYIDEPYLSQNELFYYIDVKKVNNNSLFWSIFFSFILKIITKSSKFSTKKLEQKFDEIYKIIKDHCLHAKELFDKILKSKDIFDLFEVSYNNFRSFSNITRILLILKLISNKQILSKKELSILLALIDENQKLTYFLLYEIFPLINKTFDFKDSCLFINPVVNIDFNNEKEKLNNEKFKNPESKSESSLFIYFENINEIKILINSNEVKNIYLYDDQKISIDESLIDFENIILDLSKFDICEKSKTLIEINLEIQEYFIDYLINCSKEIYERNYNFEKIENFLEYYAPDNKEKILNKIEEIFNTIEENTKSKSSISESIKCLSKTVNEIYVNCCYKMKKINNGITLKACEHEFCKSCLKKYIIYKTNNLVFLSYFDMKDNTRAIKCMKHDCKYFLSYEDIQSLFDKEIFENISDKFKERYQKNLVNIRKLRNNEINLFPCVVCGIVKKRLDLITSHNYTLRYGENKKSSDIHVICNQCIKNIPNENDEIICPCLSCEGNIEVNFDNFNVESDNNEIEIINKQNISNEFFDKINSLREEKIKKNYESSNNSNPIIRKMITPQPFCEKKCYCYVNEEGLEFHEEPVCNYFHYLHVSCIIDNYKERIKENNFSINNAYKCLLGPSGHDMNQKIIDEIIFNCDNKLYEDMQSKFNDEKNFFTCTNCKFNFILPIDDSIMFLCSMCGLNYCRYCKKFSHNGECNTVQVDRFALIEDGGKPCPYCYTIYFKDEKCDRVFCNVCRRNFNFCCSSRKTQTDAHDNFYHRPDCRFAKDFDIPNRQKHERRFSNKCNICNAIKRRENQEIPCPYPEELEERDIGNEEKDFIKKYLFLIEKEIELLDKH